MSTGDPDTPRIPKTVRRLGWVSCWNDTASEMIYPLLPVFVASTLAGGAVAVGWIEGIAEATAALVKLVSGKVSDRTQRRKLPAAVGYVIANTARPLIGLATSWWHVLALRFTDRAGKGIRAAPRDAWIVAITPEGQRGEAFGLQRALDHLGALVGPLAAFVLLQGAGLELRTVFLLSAVPGAITVLVLLIGTREPTAPASTPAGTLGIDTETNAAKEATEVPRGFHSFLLAVFIFTLGNSTDAFLLLRLESSGVPIALLPLCWSGLHMVKVLSSRLGGRLGDRIGPARILRAGWLWYALVYVGFGYLEHPVLQVGLFLAYGLHYGLSEAPERLLVSRFAPSSELGGRFGWFHLTVGIAALPASVIFGWLWQHFSPSVAFTTGAALALIAAIFLPRDPEARL